MFKQLLALSMVVGAVLMAVDSFPSLMRPLAEIYNLDIMRHIIR
jgi:hypothetical protein